MRFHRPPFPAKKKLSFGVGLVLLALSTFVLGGLVTGQAHAANCDDNAIIHCGFGSAGQFINDVEANDSGNGHHDLRGIYAFYGLSQSQYDRFARTAVQGTAYKNGTVVVNGQVVMTGAKSIGRLASYQGSGYFTQPIGSGVYYGNTAEQTFASNSLPVTVMFGDTGEVAFAVLNDCGNPIFGKTVPPVFNCNTLEATRVDDQTYKFSTDATARNGATIDHVVYNFGDGTSTSRQYPSTQVTHTFSQAGTDRVMATVYVNLPGGITSNVSGGDCVRTLSIPQPSYQCVSLTASLLESGTNDYKFVVQGKYDSNAVPVSADFDFGDGHQQNGVKLNGTMASAAHAYGPAGRTYTASAVLHFTAYGKAVTTPVTQHCETTITVMVPYCSGLQGTIIDKVKYEAQFTATAHLTDGSRLVSADFDFGDGKSQNGVQPNTASTVVVTHDYNGGGNYNALATLHFTGPGGQVVTAPTCRALVTPQNITPECKPGVPLGSAECTPCQYNPNLPSDSPECVSPQTSLPNTGAGDTIAIFAAVVVGGFLIYRQVLYRRHKAAFTAAEHGASPLPLGEPLDDTAPLASTPLATPEPARKSLRRKRPF